MSEELFQKHSSPRWKAGPVSATEVALLTSAGRAQVPSPRSLADIQEGEWVTLVNQR